MEAPASALARLSLLAALALMLGLGIGRVSAVDHPPGPVGTAGRATLDLTTHHSSVVDGIPGTRGSLSERCPAGRVVGGGFSHVGEGLHVIESRPDGIYAWRISWVQTTTDDAVIHAYAICMMTDE